MKRLTCGLLTAALTTSLLTLPAAAVSFSDIQGHWAESSIQKVTDWELFLGNERGEFMPEITMTRGMFVTVIARTAKLLHVYQEPQTASEFSDVTASDYFASSAAWAQELGIVNGMGDGRFAPHDPITREQMCIMMDRFLRVFTTLAPEKPKENTFLDRDSIGVYARPSVDTCVHLGLIQGVPVGEGLEFRPNHPATRAAVSTVLERLVKTVEGTSTEPPAVNPEKPTVNPEKPEQPGGSSSGGGDSSNGGGVTPPDGQGHTEQEKADEAMVAEYLQIMLDSYRTSTYLPTTEQTVQDCMAILMDAISDALTRRAGGQFLDRAFIRSQYAEQVRQLKAEYDKLTEDQLNQINNVVVRLAESEQIYFVMDYFGVTIEE